MWGKGGIDGLFLPRVCDPEMRDPYALILPCRIDRGVAGCLTTFQQAPVQGLSRCWLPWARIFSLFLYAEWSLSFSRAVFRMADAIAARSPGEQQKSGLLTPQHFKELASPTGQPGKAARVIFANSNCEDYSSRK